MSVCVEKNWKNSIFLLFQIRSGLKITESQYRIMLLFSSWFCPFLSAAIVLFHPRCLSAPVCSIAHCSHFPVRVFTLPFVRFFPPESLYSSQFYTLSFHFLLLIFISIVFFFTNFVILVSFYSLFLF